MGAQKLPHVITGVGYNLPDNIVDNNYFASYLETSDEWIRERTGIITRRWSTPEMSASQLAEPAARRAIEMAGISPQDVDAIIVATVTPDYVFPSTACCLQRRLGIDRVLAFDINAVCSGFLYAFVVANSLLNTDQCKNVLVVGVDLYSRIVDKNDRSTCVLFGDGAGVMLLSKSETQVKENESAFLGSKLSADGGMGDILKVAKGTASEVTPKSLMQGEHFLTMAGREVFKLAVRNLGDVSLEVLKNAGYTSDDVDYFVSHQANKRILQAMAKHLNVEESKILMNVQHYGNTSAASVPLLFAESVINGQIKRGDLVLLSAFGGGLTWGASLIRY